jgi:hypothetical protein
LALGKIIIGIAVRWRFKSNGMNQLFSLTGLFISAMDPIPGSGSGLFCAQARKRVLAWQGLCFLIKLNLKRN